MFTLASVRRRLCAYKSVRSYICFCFGFFCKPKMDTDFIAFFFLFLIWVFRLWTGTSARSTIRYTSVISAVFHDQYVSNRTRWQKNHKNGGISHCSPLRVHLSQRRLQPHRPDERRVRSGCYFRVKGSPRSAARLFENAEAHKRRNRPNEFQKV